MHITIEETDEGVLLCLLLQPSEISSELRAFASSGRGPRALPPGLSSTVPLTALRPAAPDQPLSLDVGVARVRSRPAREDIVGVLEEAIRAKKAPLGGSIGALSRGIGNLVFGTGIDPRAGVSISQQLSELTGDSIAGVHLSIAAPFFAETRSGGELGRALINDFRALAASGDTPSLERIISRLEATEGSLTTIIAAEGTTGALLRRGTDPATTAGRGVAIVRANRALKNVRDLKRQAELNLLLAEEVQGRP